MRKLTYLQDNCQHRRWTSRVVPFSDLRLWGKTRQLCEGIPFCCRSRCWYLGVWVTPRPSEGRPTKLSTPGLSHGGLWGWALLLPPSLVTFQGRNIYSGRNLRKHFPYTFYEADQHLKMAEQGICTFLCKGWWRKGIPTGYLIRNDCFIPTVDQRDGCNAIRCRSLLSFAGFSRRSWLRFPGNCRPSRKGLPPFRTLLRLSHQFRHQLIVMLLWLLFPGTV